MKNVGLLILRVTVGSYLAVHGAQKLFGVFNGPGLKGTAGFMESLGLKPGSFWGPLAAAGEFSGGVLTVLGLFSPLGPQNIMSAMATATRRAHWTNGALNAAGGYELPVTNLAAAACLALAGPGKFSLDRAFGIRFPKWLIALSWINHVAITALAVIGPAHLQAALDGVTGGSKAYEGPADSESHPDLEVEQRPRVADNAEAAQHTGI